MNQLFQDFQPLGLPEVDVLGVPFGWNRGEGDWTGVIAAVARGEPVQVIQEAGSTLWQADLPKGHSFHFGFPEFGETKGAGGENQLPLTDYPIQFSFQARIWISPTQRRFSPESNLPKVQWHPRVLWVGIGCERGTSRQLIETAIQQICRSNHLALGAIAGIATIDLKADEVGLVELCRDRNWPLRTFPAQMLADVNVPNRSAIVAAQVRTPSVAEAAAILSKQSSYLSLNLNSQDADSTKLLVPKQIFRLEGQPGAVTVAIAQAEQEYSN